MGCKRGCREQIVGGCEARKTAVEGGTGLIGERMIVGEEKR